MTETCWWLRGRMESRREVVQELLGENGESVGTETVNMEVPLLSIVKIPTLAIDDLSITFDMEVKSAESTESSSDKNGEIDANTKIGFGPFSAKVNIKGSIACHEKNTRSTDNSAKYHVSELDSFDYFVYLDKGNCKFEGDYNQFKHSHIYEQVVSKIQSYDKEANDTDIIKKKETKDKNIKEN